MSKLLKNKKIAIVIAFKGFKDPEYFIPRDILETAGAEIITVSSEKGTAFGDDGGEAKVDLIASEADPAEFDAVVFIGGPGMGENLDNREFQSIAEKAVEKGKVLAAICIAPALLAKAGLLRDRKATVWSSYMDKSAIKILKENGAVYEEKDVVIDGRIVTAAGPHAAEQFGQALIGVLTSTS